MNPFGESKISKKAALTASHLKWTCTALTPRDEDLTPTTPSDRSISTSTTTSTALVLVVEFSLRHCLFEPTIRSNDRSDSCPQQEQHKSINRHLSPSTCTCSRNNRIAYGMVSGIYYRYIFIILPTSDAVTLHVRPVAMPAGGNANPHSRLAAMVKERDWLPSL
jgi:hypothetical protein